MPHCALGHSFPWTSPSELIFTGQAETYPRGLQDYIALYMALTLSCARWLL